MSALDDLKEKLKTRKVIPFIGAGISMSVEDGEGNSVFPSWKELLEKAVQALRDSEKELFANLVEDQVRNTNNYLDAAKYARDGLKGDWNDFLDKQFNPRLNDIPDSSFEIARLIWQLGSQLVITTNYDKVLRWNKANVSTWDIEAKYRQGKALSEGLPEEPTVWHLHGYIDNPSDIILTPDGYNNLYPLDPSIEVKYKAALTTLRTLLIPYTFLFIGFSLDDSRFTDQIKQIDELFDGSTGNHFALVREADKNRIDGLGLPIKPITYEDHGLPLIELLRELVEGVSDSGASELVYVPPTHTADYSPEKPAFYVPFRSKGKDVIGREDDLEKVRQSLLTGKATRIGQAVLFEGMGGLGKTQLAVEYAYKYRSEPEYKNGIIWITVDQDIDKQLIELAEKSEWISPQSESKDKLAVALHRLKTITDCLIIFDNIESLVEIEGYLPDSRENVHLLATSRKELGGFTPVSIDLLTLEQSVEMLKRESGRNEIDGNERKVAEKIAESLGCLPLALELAGAYLLNRANVSWQEYLDLLVTNPKSVFLHKFKDSSFTEHEADVYRTLKISEDLLSEDIRLREILDLLTWSGSSPMGISLMCELLGVGKEAELTNALSLGVKLRFLQESPDRKAYAIHRLVAQVRREDIPLLDRREWVDLISSRLGDWFQQRRKDFATLYEYENEIEHLNIWQRHAFEWASANASRLLWLQAYPPFHRGRFSEANDLTSRALETYEKTKCLNNEILAYLYDHLGTITSQLGNVHRALELHKKGFELRKGFLGSSHRDMADSYENIGNDYGDLGNYDRQLEFNQKALTIRLELFGEKHSDTAASYNNVGTTYGNLGEYPNHLKFVRKAVDIYVEVLGEKHPYTATSYGNLGVAYGDLEMFDEMVEFTTKALDMRLELFGEKHPSIANSYNNLAGAYGKLRIHDKQLEYIKKAGEINRNIFGEMHPDTAISLHNLGSAYEKSGDRGQFLNYTARALDIRLELFGEKHPATASSYHNLASAHSRLRNFDLAIEFGQKAVDLKQEILGMAHPETFYSVYNLLRYFVDNTTREKFPEMRQRALNLVNEYQLVTSRSSPQFQKLQSYKVKIERSFQEKGFLGTSKKRHKKHR